PAGTGDHQGIRKRAPAIWSAVLHDLGLEGVDLLLLSGIVRQFARAPLTLAEVVVGMLGGIQLRLQALAVLKLGILLPLRSLIRVHLLPDGRFPGDIVGHSR